MKFNAKKIAEDLKIDLKKYSLDQFRKGLKVELEHRDITHGDPLKTGKIVLAHLKEVPNYYDKLEKVEKKSSPKKKRK